MKQAQHLGQHNVEVVANSYAILTIVMGAPHFGKLKLLV
jgi:hypothetical protein